MNWNDPYVLPADLAAPLAELALRQLAQAGFGEVDATGRTEAGIIADALGAPAAVFALENGQQLRVAVATGWDGLPDPIPADGVLGDALAQSSCLVLSPVPQALAASGVGGGLVVRIGLDHQPFALLAVLTPDARPFPPEARTFLRAAAGALHARFALDDTRNALEDSRARALAVIETTVDGVITIDEQGAIETFNAGAERIFEYAAREVIGRNVNVLMPEPTHSGYDGYLEDHRRAGVHLITGPGREVKGRRKSGATFPMDLTVSEIAIANGGRIFTGLVRDITNRRTLEREVLRVADAERRRIGQDLHDGLGQELTAIGLFLSRAARRLDTEGSASTGEVRRLVGLLGEADTHARSLAQSLVPVELEQNGLAAALNRLAERARALYDVDVEARTTGSGPAEAEALTGDAASNLYWIAQEAVSNAAQHGQASRVAIRLVRGTDQLRLRIEDDGVGVDAVLRRSGVVEPVGGAGLRSDCAEEDGPGRPMDQRGMGLRIMHYRAHLVGGSLEICPGAECGTVVTCTVPLTGLGFQTP